MPKCDVGNVYLILECLQSMTGMLLDTAESRYMRGF